MSTGDSLEAAITPIGDVDYYKFAATAGDTVDILGRERNGSGLGGAILLFSSSGSYLFEYLTWGGSSPRLIAIIPSTGMYYARYTHELYWGGFPNSRTSESKGLPPTNAGVAEAIRTSVGFSTGGMKFDLRTMVGAQSAQKTSLLETPLLDYESGDYTIHLSKFVRKEPDIEYAYVSFVFCDRIRLQAEVMSNGLPTLSIVEYGTDDTYGNTYPMNAVPVSSVAPTWFDNVEIDGLSPSTTYHYRVVATNTSGIARSADMSFTTPPASEGITLLSSGTSSNLFAVCAHGSGRVTAVGDYGTISRTTDGGSHWNTTHWIVPEALYGVAFIDNLHGYAVGQGGRILRTVDGGVNWEVRSSPTSEWLIGISFGSSTDGIIVGANGIILNSTNAGESWNTQTSGVASWIKSVSHTSPTIAFCVGDGGLILKTTNGGVSWSSQPSGTSSDLYGVQFLDPNIGFAAGQQGTALHTTDGGSTWQVDISTTTQGFFGTAFGDALHGMAIGNNGIIIRTGSGGTKWQFQNSGTFEQLRAATYSDPATAYIVGHNGIILRTTSNERSAQITASAGWNLISVPLIVSDSTVVSLFPKASSQAFGFEGEYVAATALQSGRGYWLKFDSLRSQTISGRARPSGIVPVQEGWNLIGGFDLPSDPYGASGEPEGIIATPFYGYSGRYTAATVLDPGHGYWVKTSQAGVIRLDASQFKTHVPHVDEMDTWLRIEFEDTNHAQYTLALAAESDFDSTRVELPPLPPSGVPDIRFTSNRSVEHLGEASHIISLMSVASPLRIAVKNTHGKHLRMQDCLGGSLFKAELTEETSAILSRPVGNLLLENMAGDAVAPATFALEQIILTRSIRVR